MRRIVCSIGIHTLLRTLFVAFCDSLKSLFRNTFCCKRIVQRGYHLAMLVLTALVASADYSPPVLGLAIVKHVLEAHKSVMYVQSLPAQGTAISFTLKK